MIIDEDIGSFILIQR